MTNMECIDYMFKSKEELIDIIDQYKDDMQRLKDGYDKFKILNRSLESDIDILKEEKKNLNSDIDKLKKENKKNNGVIVTLQDSLKDKIDYAKELEEDRRKTKEVLEKYCGKYVTGPIPTIVGAIIDDYFYQKAETEYQVKELQKAEKTIEGLNKELVEYADKVEALKKDASFIPTLPTLAERINDITCRYSMPVTPIDHRKARTEHIFQCVQELAEYAKKQRDHICRQDAIIANQTEQINKIEEKNEKLILVQDDNAIEHAAEITGLKREISTLKRELEERKNKRSPRWPSDVMRICVLEDKVDKLTKENEYLKYKNQLILSEPCYGGLSIVAENRRLREEVESLKGQNEVLKIKNAYPICPVFGVNGTIHKLREENDKLKDALEFCQKEASSAREHAHNVEVNAERIRKGLD